MANEVTQPIPDFEKMMERFHDLFDLQWPIRGEIADVLDFPKIETLGEEQVHALSIPADGIGWMEEETIWATLIARARIGETRNPVFTANYFPEDFDPEDPAQAEAASMAVLASQIAEIWEHDEIRLRDPQLENRLLDRVLTEMYTAAQDGATGELEFLIGFALLQAHINRGGMHEFDPVMENIRLLISETSTDFDLGVRALAEFASALPALPESGTEAVELYGGSVRETLRIIGFPEIQPQLEFIGGKYVWIF